jgi:hypothetical protein
VDRIRRKYHERVMDEVEENEEKREKRRRE